MAYTPHFPLAPVPARPFTPVPVRARHDGWTPERQIDFIEALAACGCVTDAAARVGMSSHSAYALRLRDDAEAFREAWNAALTTAVRLLSEGAFSRAVHGVAVPHYHHGEKVGEHRRYNEGLTRFLLQHLDPFNYTPGLIYNARKLDEARVAAVVNAVLAMREAAELDGDPGEPGMPFTPPDAPSAETERVTKPRATAGEVTATAAGDGKNSMEDHGLGGDGSRPSRSFERWVD